MNRYREGEYMAPHPGSFDEIISNTRRGPVPEWSRGSMEVEGPLADETIDGAEIAPGLEGVQVKIWKARQPEIQGVAVTFEGPNANSITLLPEQRVFPSVDEAKAFLRDLVEKQNS